MMGINNLEDEVDTWYRVRLRIARSRVWYEEDVSLLPTIMMIIRWICAAAS